VCVQCAGVLQCRMMLKGTTSCFNRVHGSLHVPPLPPGRLLRPLSVFFIIWQSKCEHDGSVLTGFLPSFPSQIWVSDVTFVTFCGDKKCDASHSSHFWEECDALAHEIFFFNLWRFSSHPSRKTSHFGTACTKLFWTGRNVTIRLGLKKAFLFPSQISHISRKREAGRPFGLGPTLWYCLRGSKRPQRVNLGAWEALGGNEGLRQEIRGWGKKGKSRWSWCPFVEELKLTSLEQDCDGPGPQGRGLWESLTKGRPHYFRGARRLVCALVTIIFSI